MNELTHLDLFSGIGGFSLAFEAEGFRTIGFAEIDPYASAVLKKHWPNVRNYGDVRNVPPGRYNVLSAGFPCQDASQAQQKKANGLSGKRTGLWFPTLEIIRRDRPDFVQLENVPALRTRGADEVLLGLEESGYTAQAFVVGAWAVGAVHGRSRTWIIAHSGSKRLAQASLGRKGEMDNGIYEARLHNPFMLHAFRNWREGLESNPELRNDNGLPGALDRIKCLGNAIVPQVAQIFARGIKSTYASPCLTAHAVSKATRSRSRVN